MHAGKTSNLAQTTEVERVAYRMMDKESVQVFSTEWQKKARAEAAEFPQLLNELHLLLRTFYPPHLIAVIAGWGLRTAVGSSGGGDKPLIEGISQHHAELLQAIAATLQASEWGRQPAEPEDIQQTINAIISLARSCASRRLIASAEISNPQERMKLVLQERLRMHTQMVRNWGPYRVMLQILRELYAPLDAGTRAYHTFGTLDVIAVADQTVIIIEKQVNERFRLLQSIFKAHDIPELIRDFFARFPGVTGNPDELIESLHPEETLESVRARLISHADRWLVINCVVPVATVAEACGLTESTTQTILDRLSLHPGDLSETNPEHLFLSNPVWMKPGLDCSGEYFFPFPQSSVSFLHQILRVFCEEAIPEALTRRRSVYLEQKTEEIIKKALPGAVVMPGAKWRWEGTGYQTDVLAVLDRTILIAECKSHALSPSGLRGAPDRVRHHVRQLIVEASLQSSRLEQVIARARNGEIAAIAVTTELGLIPAEIDAVIRISVTLDDLTILAGAEGNLKVAGWVPQDLDLAPTLNISDLACVAEILSRPSRFIDYLYRRNKFGKSYDVFGFEFDFLGLYLSNNFCFPQPAERTRLVISEMSRDIDLYYQRLDLGYPSDRPAPQMHQLISDTIDRLEARRPPGWTTMVRSLLSIGDLDDQKECVADLEKLRQLVERSPSCFDQPHALIITPENEPELVILFNVKFSKKRSRSFKTISRLVDHALADSGRSRCLFVIRSLEGWNTAPYELIGIASS